MAISFGGYDEERFVSKLDDRLLCPICFKVVKDPVQCPNEHHFCRSCILRCLNETSETCPTCNHYLTEETLAKPTRFFMQTLERLMIHCDHASRGCREVGQLEFLDRHVESCGYSPTRCTNTGCSEVINRNEQERHENELCRFRRIVCDECGETVIWNSKRVHSCFIRKETDDLVNNLKEFKRSQDELNRKLVADIARQNVVIDDLCRRNREVTERCDLLSGMRKIYVCGGRDEKLRHRSVESFSWPENSWTLEPEMNLIRSAPAAFVYRGKIYITCGSNGTEFTDSVERLNVVKNMKKWVKSSVKMPVKCNGHGMVSHENSAIFTGGLIDKNNASDGIYKIELTSPYTTTLLTQLPEMRSHHGCQIIDNQVVVAGGRTSNYCKDTKNTVFAYDINNNECKTLPPLPFPVSEMATVSYRGNIILIGGVNEKGETLNTVFMYEVKTGKIKELPRLNNQRAASAAVITGNMIIVMGGYYYKTIWLKIVECLDLSIEKSEWKELPPMTKERAYASAVLL
ncbi:kelch domain-containing protein 8A-like isoform X2 [Dendronephthya gigantea]|uniref:kelch domain-containing protein 8A-like isoform X2 n=1 Tax=Dendronephthya gigantea TaxID=151771 RepID=UPI0010698EE0|nr:kelch domain-containing protein 8A-like isoform X2 [Dendronephthya gigantea]